MYVYPPPHPLYPPLLIHAQFLIYYLVAGAEHFTFYGTNAITPHMYKASKAKQARCLLAAPPAHRPTIT